MGDTGLEQGDENHLKTSVSSDSTEGAPTFFPTLPTDPALRLIAMAWPELHDDDRRAILTIVQRAHKAVGEPV